MNIFGCVSEKHFKSCKIMHSSYLLVSLMRTAHVPEKSPSGLILIGTVAHGERHIELFHLPCHFLQEKPNVYH